MPLNSKHTISILWNQIIGFYATANRVFFYRSEHFNYLIPWVEMACLLHGGASYYAPSKG